MTKLTSIAFFAFILTHSSVFAQQNRTQNLTNIDDVSSIDGESEDDSEDEVDISLRAGPTSLLQNDLNTTLPLGEAAGSDTDSQENFGFQPPTAPMPPPTAGCAPEVNLDYFLAYIFSLTQNPSLQHVLREYLPNILNFAASKVQQLLKGRLVSTLRERLTVSIDELVLLSPNGFRAAMRESLVRVLENSLKENALSFSRIRETIEASYAKKLQSLLRPHIQEHIQLLEDQRRPSCLPRILELIIDYFKQGRLTSLQGALNFAASYRVNHHFDQVLGFDNKGLPNSKALKRFALECADHGDSIITIRTWALAQISKKET